MVSSLTSLDYPDATFDGALSRYSTIHNPGEDVVPKSTHMPWSSRVGPNQLSAVTVDSDRGRAGYPHRSFSSSFTVGAPA